jgi:hypothetical protein
VEKSVKDEQSIRQFLKGMYGGHGPNGETVFVPEKGVQAENLSVVGESRLLHGKVSDDLLESLSIPETAVRRTCSLMCVGFWGEKPCLRRVLCSRSASAMAYYLEP